MKKKKEKELKEEVADLKKSNKIMKNILLFILVIIILLGIFALGWHVGVKLAEKEKELLEEKEEVDEEATIGKSIYTQDSEIASKTYEEKLKYYFNNDKEIPKKEFEKNLEKGNGNDVIVRNEIKEFFAYLNGDILIESNSDILLTIFDYDGELTGKDLIALKSIYMLPSIYDIEYVDLPDYIGGYQLISKETYQKMGEYFASIPVLQSYDDLFIELHGKDFDANKVCEGNELCLEINNNQKKYINKDYYVAFQYGDGYGSLDLYFEVEDIVKKSKTEYEVSYNIYQSYYDDNENEINKQINEGILKVEVVNGHLKYYPSIMNAVK